MNPKHFERKNLNQKKIIGNQLKREIAPEKVPIKVASRTRSTMTDVAKTAGVSQSSVSLILNQVSGARVADATRHRVMDAAQNLGYQLPHARRQINNKTRGNVIAYLVDEISTSPHTVVSLDGARDAGWEAGYLVAAHVTRSNPELEEATILDIKRDKSIVGIIYSTIFTRRVTLPKSLENIPTVLLNCYTEPRRNFAIVPGERKGGYSATSHLLSLGHTRIGFINGEPWMDAAIERLKGYREALAIAGIAFDESIVRCGDWLPLRGYQLAFELLQQRKRPTAILCGNDLMAIGVLEAASELGLKVPENLSVMGYDDQELSRYTHPPLSTLVLPNYEMGQRATEILLDIAVRGKTLHPRTIKINGPIVVRSTTGKATRANRVKPIKVS
jgi:LacI family transcriptional regulator